MSDKAADSTGAAAAGTLFVVATPIGNLQDLSPRAATCLRDADLLLAEDTRHTRKLLDACGIARAGGIESLHEHNERQRVPALLDRLRAGTTVALVTDAGTPLMSDPGAVLVAAAAQAGVEVVAVPGP
ncbi:MAG TPA: SAM-dependent methyltransferase, partial [Steroidobacteraceae bacterium]|nr:SAM-dependent methyltransferase [Steroidobacteraceae bacterium]